MEEMQITDEDTPQTQAGVWVILELFGHKVLAGLLTRDEILGAPMLRVDVPATTNQPAFTRHYSPSAVYSVTYVSEEAANMTAEEISEKPVTVYVPRLGDIGRLEQENEQLKQKFLEIQRQLSPGYTRRVD